jgi:hypothetical protein
MKKINKLKKQKEILKKENQINSVVVGTKDNNLKKDLIDDGIPKILLKEKTVLKKSFHKISDISVGRNIGVLNIVDEENKKNFDNKYYDLFIKDNDLICFLDNVKSLNSGTAEYIEIIENNFNLKNSFENKIDDFKKVMEKDHLIIEENNCCFDNFYPGLPCNLNPLGLSGSYSSNKFIY